MGNWKPVMIFNKETDLEWAIDALEQALDYLQSMKKEVRKTTDWRGVCDRITTIRGFLRLQQKKREINP